MIELECLIKTINSIENNELTENVDKLERYLYFEQGWEIMLKMYKNKYKKTDLLFFKIPNLLLNLSLSLIKTNNSSIDFGINTSYLSNSSLYIPNSSNDDKLHANLELIGNCIMSHTSIESIQDLFLIKLQSHLNSISYENWNSEKIRGSNSIIMRLYPYCKNKIYLIDIIRIHLGNLTIIMKHINDHIDICNEVDIERVFKSTLELLRHLYEYFMNHDEFKFEENLNKTVENIYKLKNTYEHSRACKRKKHKQCIIDHPSRHGDITVTKNNECFIQYINRYQISKKIHSFISICSCYDLDSLQKDLIDNEWSDFELFNEYISEAIVSKNDEIIEKLCINDSKSVLLAKIIGLSINKEQTIELIFKVFEMFLSNRMINLKDDNSMMKILFKYFYEILGSANYFNSSETVTWSIKLIDLIEKNDFLKTFVNDISLKLASITLRVSFIVLEAHWETNENKLINQNHLCKLLIKILKSDSLSDWYYDYNLIEKITDLYLKCNLFRLYFNEYFCDIDLKTLLWKLLKTINLKEDNNKLHEINLRFLMLLYHFNKLDLCEVYAFMEIKLTSNAEIFSNYSNIMILNHENQTNIDKNEIKLFDDTRCQRTSFRDDYNYDADTELHVEDNSNVQANYENLCQKNLILFPQIVELLLKFLTSKLKSEYQEDFQSFLKLIVHLLKTNSFNIEIFIHNGFVQYLIDCLDICSFNQENNCIDYCFEALELIYLNHIDVKQLYKMIEWIINGKYQHKISKLLNYLGKNLQLVQSSTYLRFPFSSNDFENKCKSSFEYLIKNFREIVLDMSMEYEKKILTNMINLKPNDVSSFKIPFKTNSQSNITNSYSIVFTLRYNNLIETDNKNLNESYYHLLSQNDQNNQDEFSYELWLGSNGNLLFVRRMNNSILFNVNLIQLKQKQWNFIYISYNEKRLSNGSKLECQIKFSINLKPIVNKEIFEIHLEPSLLNEFLICNSNEESSLNIGHNRIDRISSSLFYFDMGQIILSKDASFTIEHLVLLMQIIDTNCSQIDVISSRNIDLMTNDSYDDDIFDTLKHEDWGYLNGYLNVNTISNLNDNHVEYCEEIKQHVILIYQPRYSHICATPKQIQATIIQSNRRITERLAYQDILCPCLKVTQSTIDIALTKLGGLNHFLMLIAYYIGENESVCELLTSTLIDLLNKRPEMNYNFKTTNGYCLLSRIFTTKMLTGEKKLNIVQYFYILLNSCFKESFLIPENNCEVITSNRNLHLININLLTNVILDWKFIGYSSINDQDKTKLCLLVFQALNRLLSDYENTGNLSNINIHSYNSNIFYKYKIFDLLINYLLDANSDKFLFNDQMVYLFIQIFKNFNTVCCSLISKMKYLIESFNRFLLVLHPEFDSNIVNPKINYFDMFSNFDRIDDDASLSSSSFISPQESTNNLTLEKIPTIPNSNINHKKKDNSNNLCMISIGIMEIVYDLLKIMPDSILVELLSSKNIQFETYIMLVMSPNKQKRLKSLNIFLHLLRKLQNQTIQSLIFNKDYLIHSMINQLNQNDELSEEFYLNLLSSMLDENFNDFDEVLNIVEVKKISDTDFLTILIGILYKSRVDLKLCKNILLVIYKILDSNNQKFIVEQLIYQIGFIQVLLKLIYYFTVDYRNLQEDEENVKRILTYLKDLICLIFKTSFKSVLNTELRDSNDIFILLMQSLTTLCFETATNKIYDKYNYNLKLSVLNMTQIVMIDVNSMCSQEVDKQPQSISPSILFQKLRTITFRTEHTVSQDSYSNIIQRQLSKEDTQQSTEQENKFQKFLQHLVDFVFIIYENISNLKNESNEIDVNDQIVIFIFEILLSALLNGISQSNNKSKYTALAKQNINFVKTQFRRFLTFMMHPNHKSQIKMQLLKRLINTFSSETILRAVFINTDNLPSTYSLNLKLNIFFKTFIEKHESNLESKEVINTLKSCISVLNNGQNMTQIVNYYLNLNKIKVNLQKTPSYVDSLHTQFDKDFDTEIITIYKSSNLIWNKFLNQFSSLKSNISDASSFLNENLFTVSSNARKNYLQNYKLKRIRSYSLRKSWNTLLDQFTVENYLWSDILKMPKFSMLDPTEGPNRERRRLKKSHLHIQDKFFKQEAKDRLENENANNKFSYLLKSDDECLNSNRNKNSLSIGDSIAYYLRNNEIISYYSCKHVMPYCEIEGEFLLTETRIHFVAEDKDYKFLMGLESNISYSWSYDDMKEMHKRRYLLKDVGLELFFNFGQTILIAFNNSKERNNTYKSIQNKGLANLLCFDENAIKEATDLWQESKMSNFEYLMQLNKFSGRSFNDLMQYPIYPHILCNYISDTIDLSIKENYRDLTKPVAIQKKEREEKYLQNYRSLLESNQEPYHYASLYSNTGTVLHYLVRLPPFTKMFLDYQDQNFDVADRTFHSMATSWLLSSGESTTDFKELIPEFYTLHEFLTNSQDFNFGLRQNGESIDNVQLPLWSKQDPRLFICVLRQAIESEYVTQNLNYWIDLIFGYKQNKKAALDAINCYHPACYFGYPVEQITDDLLRKAIETMIKTWGQTPKQIFSTSHPQPNLTVPIKRTINFRFPNESIHRRVLNPKWGSYVGSLDKPNPVCIQVQTCNKKLLSLISTSASSVIGLSAHKCLLIKRIRDSGTKVVNCSEKSYMAILNWSSYDDFLKIKCDKEKNYTKLLSLRANELDVVKCACIGAKYLILAEKSGLLSVYKLKQEKNQILNDSFYCHLFGHTSEIVDIFVCLSFSTMITCSIDGLVIIWDTNNLNYVNSIILKDYLIQKCCISTTTNDIAIIARDKSSKTLNSTLFYYTGNCEFIGRVESPDETEFKSLCFSNLPEGLNVNVIALGLNNRQIYLYSTWDLTLLRSIQIDIDNPGEIIGITFTLDGKRLYALDSNSKVFVFQSLTSSSTVNTNFSFYYE